MATTYTRQHDFTTDRDATPPIAIKADRVDAELDAVKTSIDTIVASGGVSTAMLADLAVTTAKIADNAITAAKILDNAITTAKITDANVTTAKIADANITTGKLADSSVTTAKVADANITTAKITDANITSAKLATDSVTTIKIADANVTTAKITDANVTTAKIADANITTAKLADNSVTTAKVTDANITTAKIADANITSDKLASDAVTTAKILDANITTAKITDANVTTAKIADSAVTDAKLPSNLAMDATKIADGSISNTEFQYLNGATSNLQAQFDSMVDPSFEVDVTSTNTAKNKSVSNNLAKGWQDTKTAFDAQDISVHTDPLTMDEESTPSNPASNKHKLYFKSDGTLYKLNSSGTEAQVGGDTDSVVTNAADIFTTNVRLLEQHGTQAAIMEKGFTDELLASNDMIDESASSGYTYDATNDNYVNTVGATGVNDDKPYTTEGNYIQQSWDEVIVGADAVFTNGSATVTTSGTFPTNCASGRISQDGTNWYNITTRDSATQLTLSAVFAQSTVTGTFDIRLTEFDSGAVRLNSFGGNDGINSNTVIYLPSNTNFTDISTATNKGAGTAVGSNAPTISTAQKKFGAGSVNWSTANDGNYVTYAASDYRLMPSAITDLWTIDWWVYFSSSISSYTAIAGIGTSSSSYWMIANSNSTTFDLECYDNGGGGGGASNEQWTISAPSTGQWYHYAMIKGWGGDSTKVALCIDGVANGTVNTWNSSFYTPTQPSGTFYLGRGAYPTNRMMRNGYIDNFRIQREAVWTANFTPPTEEYTGADNPMTEYVSVADSYSQSSDVSAWSDINSSTVTETLVSQNAYYWYSFDPASSYGAGTEIVIPKPAIAAVYDGIDSDTAYISHFDGSDASTTITDSSGNGITMTVSGSKTFLDTSITKIGTASFRQQSGAVAGSDWALSSANSLFNISTTDWTIDAWVYSVASGGGTMLGIGEGTSFATNNLHFQMEHGAGSGSTGSYTTLYENTPSGTPNKTHSTIIAPTLSSWQHYAWVRQGTVLKSYLNGTLNSTHTCNADYGWTGSTFLKLGNRLGSSGGLAFGQNGEMRMDEFRFSRTARYTGNFTPRTTAFTDGLTSAAIPAYVRPIAKNDSGTWKHNSNASANNTFTAATSTVNDMLHSVSQAVSSQAQNRLTSTEISSLVDADFELTNGFTTSDSKLTRGLTLVSSSTTANPEVSLFRVNYDSDASAISLISKQWNGSSGRPSAPATAPETMYLFVVDEQTSGTPSYFVSRDGTNFTAVTFDASWVFSGTKMARRASIDMSATNTGTNPKFKVTCPQGSVYKIHAVGLQTRG